MEMDEEPQVKTAAAVFQDLCYNYRDQLSAGIIVAGYDEKKGGQVSITCNIRVPTVMESQGKICGHGK